MAVPKRKTSKARRDKRRANWKLSVPGMVKCPSCGECKMPHSAGKACGSYNGKEVISAEAQNIYILHIAKAVSLLSGRSLLSFNQNPKVIGIKYL